MNQMVPPPDHSLEPETVAVVRDLLARRPIWYGLPEALKAGFTRQRAEDFIVLSDFAGPLSLGLYGVVALVALLQFGAELTHGWNAWVFWGFIGFATVVMAVSMWLCRMPAIRRNSRYLWIVSVSGSLEMAAPLTASMLVTNPVMQSELSYVTIFTVTVVSLATKAPIAVAALTALLGLLEAALVVSALGVKPANWWLVNAYYLGSTMIMLFIATITENLERWGYLRGLLLDHESGEIKRLNASLARERVETERLNEILAKLAYQDQLSGLANRRHFLETIDAEWRRARRDKFPLGLLFIDVDYFKRYNDTYGHAAGDNCLAQVADVLRASVLRVTDLPARFGGEEFVILLPNTDRIGAREVAERVLHGIDALALPHTASDAAPFVTASIGLAVQESSTGSYQELLERADQALYAAKAAGRHCVREAS